MAEETTATTTTEGTTAAAAATTEATATTGVSTTQTTEAATLLGAKAQEKATEGTEGTKDADKQTETKDAKAAEGAPEKYEFTAPEGVTLDPASLEKFTPLAKELNLSQEGAQKLVDFEAARMAEFQQAHAAQVTEWGTSVAKDKELGGDNMPTTLKAIDAFMTHFGTPELRSFLNDSGIGNHPELVRAIARAGKDMLDDKFHTGFGGDGPTKDAAEILYGK